MSSRDVPNCANERPRPPVPATARLGSRSLSGKRFHPQDLVGAISAHPQDVVLREAIFAFPRHAPRNLAIFAESKRARWRARGAYFGTRARSTPGSRSYRRKAPGFYGGGGCCGIIGGRRMGMA